MKHAERLPTSLRVVAALFVLNGIVSLIEVVVALINGRIDLNFGVLGLFIGPGLLRLHSGWRTVALILLVIAVVGLPVVAMLFLSASGPFTITFFGVPFGSTSKELALVVAAILFAISAWQLRVLTSAEIRRLFEAAPRR